MLFNKMLYQWEIRIFIKLQSFFRAMLVKLVSGCMGFSNCIASSPIVAWYQKKPLKAIIPYAIFLGGNIFFKKKSVHFSCNQHFLDGYLKIPSYLIQLGSMQSALLKGPFKLRRDLAFGVEFSPLCASLS